MVVSRMGDQIGRVLSGRYRLVAPIGSGASAQVFLADDTRLRRRVAVKLLHAALSEDESFLRRFRAEAQAAAALNHPHILSVYDWGDDTDGEPYLVTEYLGGGSLRGMLDAGRRLSPSQTLMIGLEAARALDHAHRRGIVHRDIKPANLLFGEEGRLRIADFGLARALAEAAWTEPTGAVLGTARYASPEQAKGELVTGRADVYSLGLVLIEAVTGSVPFAADTTIGTLMGRVERAVEVPVELGPLRRVLVRAGHPDAADRPDAGEFAVGLMAAAEELDRPAPLPLVGAVPALGDGLAPERDVTLLPPPKVGDPTVVTPGDGDQRDDSADSQPAPEQPAGRRARRRARRAERRAAIKAGLVRRRRWPRVALAVLLVAVVAAAAAFAFLRLRVPSHEIPPLVGLTQGQAEGLIDDNGWDVEVFDGRQDGSTPGDVIAQDPAEGESLKEDETVRITVSLGNTMTDVPTDLPGKSLADAQVAIEAAGLVLGEPQRQLDEAVPGDVVISLAPDTKPQLPKGDPVVLVVSDGPAPRTVPAVAAGSTFEQAHAALAAVQLVAQRVEEFSDTVPVGQVIRIDPAAGASVPRDSAVNVVVSKGPELIPIPNVIGRTASEAAGILEQSGFGVAQVIGNPNRAVIATDPPPGELHRRGAQVTIVTRF